MATPASSSGEQPREKIPAPATAVSNDHTDAANTVPATATPTEKPLDRPPAPQMDADDEDSDFDELDGKLMISGNPPIQRICCLAATLNMILCIDRCAR